jgi:hypothetical protein
MAKTRTTFMQEKIMNPQTIQEQFAAPFHPDEVGFKPQSVKGNRAMAIAYIDARCVEDRLDSVVGVDGWQDAYDVLPDGSVVCRLSVKIGEEWITKSDVGSPSSQPDGGDRMKAAFSDALKRAAIKFGIGRYLYSLDAVWCDYDPVKRQFTTRPKLPAWALPKQSKPIERPAYQEHPPEQPPLADQGQSDPSEDYSSHELVQWYKVSWVGSTTDQRRHEIVKDISAKVRAGRLSQEDRAELLQMVAAFCKRHGKAGAA